MWPLEEEEQISLSLLALQTGQAAASFLCGTLAPQLCHCGRILKRREAGLAELKAGTLRAESADSVFLP